MSIISNKPCTVKERLQWAWDKYEAGQVRKLPSYSINPKTGERVIMSPTYIRKKAKVKKYLVENLTSAERVELLAELTKQVGELKDGS